MSKPSVKRLPPVRRIPAPPPKKGKGQDNRLPKRGPQYGGYK